MRKPERAVLDNWQWRFVKDHVDPLVWQASFRESSFDNFSCDCSKRGWVLGNSDYPSLQVHDVADVESLTVRQDCNVCLHEAIIERDNNAVKRDGPCALKYNQFGCYKVLTPGTSYHTSGKSGVLAVISTTPISVGTLVLSVHSNSHCPRVKCTGLCSE